MAVVKEGMAHGELSLDSYTTVWEECLSQVYTIFFITKYFKSYRFFIYLLMYFIRYYI